MTPENIKLMSQGIALSALAVGTLMVGKRYYDSYKLQKVIYQTEKQMNHMYHNYFVVDRLIDADCDGKLLVVGVNGHKTANILSHQGIRWGNDGEIKRLTKFSKDGNELRYTFEDEYTLTINKTANDKIIYAFQTTDNVIIKEMNDIVRRSWKTISMDSKELDEIAQLK